MATVNINLVNQTTSSTVYAYITGQALDKNNALFLLQSDAKTPYYPTSPSSTGQPLAANCAIPLGPPNSTKTATIPHIAGGRIWFTLTHPLTFLLNPGPGLVEPSVANPSDPNHSIQWGFCEFTYNPSQLFVNISYVDFVSLPIALSLTSRANSTVHSVTGMSSSGLSAVCAALLAQQNKDNAGWSSLIERDASGGYLRALSPNTAIARNGAQFKGYYDAYVNQVYAKYAHPTALKIDTQAQWGSVSGSTNASGALTFGDLTFTKPSTADIFSCSTGPFTASSSIERGALIARLSAAFNRSTLLVDETTPSKSSAEYYTNATTNHYARIVHAANADLRGYAFPFDDVAPDGGADQSGSVSDGAPGVLTVRVGGGGVGKEELVKQG